MPDSLAHESIWTHLSTVAFRQEWIDAGGIRTRYVQAGPDDAPALIMLHGTGGTWEAYCATIGPHSRYFKCFALDFLGSGYTDKPDRDYQIADYVEHVRNFMHAVGRIEGLFHRDFAWLVGHGAVRPHSSVDGREDHAECAFRLRRRRGGNRRHYRSPRPGLR